MSTFRAVEASQATLPIKAINWYVVESGKDGGMEGCVHCEEKQTGDAAVVMGVRGLVSWLTHQVVCPSLKFTHLSTQIQPLKGYRGNQGKDHTLGNEGGQR